MLEGADELALEFFWRCRRGTPSDQPIDPVRALDLYERLYGPPDTVALLDKLSAMDSAFAEHVAREMAAKHETSLGKKGR